MFREGGPGDDSVMPGNAMLWKKGTGDLNPEAAAAHIDEALSSMPEGWKGALFMIEVTGEEERYGGHRKSDECGKKVAENLSRLFRATDLIGRIEKQKYLVFLMGAFNTETIYRKAADICKKVGAVVESYGMRLYVGAYMTERRTSYGERYDKTQEAVREARRGGKGSTCIKTDSASEIQAQSVKADSCIPISSFLQYMDESVCLLEVGDEINVIYASSGFYHMLGLKKDDFALPCPFKKIGLDSDDQKIYEEALRKRAENGGVVSFIQKISGNGKEWIWRRTRASRIECPDSLFPVMLEVSTDITELVEKEHELQESNERFRVAFGQTPHVMWEVDVKKRIFNSYAANTNCFHADFSMKEFPDSLIEEGVIHPSSASDFREFAEKLLRGNEAGNGNFIIRDRVNNGYGWVSLTYRMTYDRDGSPLKAIGVQQKLPDVSGMYENAFPRRPLPEILRYRVLARIRVNLTADFVESMWLNGVDQTAWTWGRTYTQIIKSGELRLFKGSEGKDFRKRFSREDLIRSFGKKEYWSSREYRIVNDGGDIRWMADLVNLQPDPKTGDIYMFACFADVQQKHDWENLAGKPCFDLKKNGLYSSQTVKEIAEAIIQRAEGESFCALSLIQTNAGTYRQGESDKINIKKLKKFIFIAVSYMLGMDCIACRYSEDALLVFFPNAGSRFELKRRIEDAFAYVRVAMTSLTEFESFRFVAGTVTERGGNADYDEMLLRASYLCELWKNAAMDTVEFPNEEEDWAWANLRGQGLEGYVNEEEEERGLTAGEQKVVFSIVAAMLTAATIQISLDSTLNYIGKYYNADRTYVLSLSDSRREVTMLYEWTGNGKYSIQNVVSGMKIGKFPLLVRCLDEKRPVLVESSRRMREHFEGEVKWHFIAFPIQGENGGAGGFLCVENAREHFREVALLKALVPYILKEFQRFRDQLKRGHESRYDVLNRLPNLRCYKDVIHSLNSDSYASMGAVALDVPNFSEINSSLGFDYGKELLRYIAENLNRIFGNNFIFRTWDAEFVVLFPNTLQEVFKGRCTRLRTALQRRYSRQIRLGYTWSDGIFNANDLVREARFIMNCDNIKKEPVDRLGFLERKMMPEPVHSDGDSFLLYLQPKIDMRDGRLVGAEALVRGVDGQGKIIMPVEFIEEMEKDGSIRKLDFFMLEKVMAQLAEWKSRGLPLINISVNISRKTLFNPTILASVLAIQSHFPDISPELVDLEITETAADVGKVTFGNTVERFRRCGIQFELDDFGSRYANISIFSNIHFHTIKLDRSLINDLPENEIGKVLIKDIVDICHTFDMVCIAEGVETERQKDMLLQAGCSYAQGFYYSRPIPVEQFEKNYLIKKKESEGGRRTDDESERREGEDI